MKLTKKRTLTEIEQLKKDFPEFNKTEHIIELSTDGKILNIETKDKKLQKYFNDKGFT
jgi:hypothetical protein|tara:strand:- start:28 stop:201 length:174 start_codon:yes stop_codon:yes gene_type:complete